MKERRGWVMRQREKERGRRREWKTSLWWWWDLFRPGSFDVSVTGAPEPGTGSLVKHATTHLPRHHSLALFSSDSSLPPPSAFPSLFFYSAPVLDFVLSPSLFSLLARGELSATRSKRAVVFLVPPARSSISRYRNSPLYPFTRS